MTRSAPEPTTAPTGRDGFLHTSLPLGLAQTIFWASTFYLLPALILSIEAESGWSKAMISAAMTGAILMSALCARTAGRLIDAGMGRVMMSTAAVCSAVFLITASLATSYWQFVICWLLIGVCMAGFLYEPCFSILTHHCGAQAKRKITQVALIAGFASTVGFPLANAVAASFDWRATFQVFAISIVVAGLPLAVYGIGQLPAFEHHPDGTQNAISANGKNGRRRLYFWLIALAFTLGSVAHIMVIAQLMPLLAERGTAIQTAVFAAMVVGPAQVVGRIFFAANERYIGPAAGAIICLAGLSAAIVLLNLSGTLLWLIVLSMTLQGASWGLVSIIRPTLTREVLGQNGFGATSGAIAAIATLGVALAPALGAWLGETFGYQVMLLAGTLFSLLGCGMLIALIVLTRGAASEQAA